MCDSCIWECQHSYVQNINECIRVKMCVWATVCNDAVLCNVCACVCFALLSVNDTRACW